ncbi:MAG: 4a-hydroxytetrahydrobiopterin dehydratase [Acidimicrobiales bacterium]
MIERMSPRQFHEADGVSDWRMLANEVGSYFRTGSFAKGVAFVDVIGTLADDANHHPDVDLRYSGVAVRMMTHEVNGLSQRDVDLARKISAAARTLGAPADPTSVQDVHVSINTLDVAAVRPFWRAAFGFKDLGDGDLHDPNGRGPSIRFQETRVARLQRNQVRVDVIVPHDQADERVAAAISAGGRLVSDEHAPTWWVVADSEGNEVCVATWTGRG